MTDQPGSGGNSPANGEKADEGAILEVIHQMQSLVLKHPAVAQELFAALVKEGRRFCSTPEGEVWRRKLAGSALIERGRAFLEISTLGLLDENEGEGLPSRLLEVLAIAARHHALETVLSQAVSEVAF